MICIYHSRDLDGFASGAIVKRKYPDAKLIGFDYGQSIPWDDIPEGEPIVMIDVSVAMSEMSELSRRSQNMVWIDHHRSAIKEYNELSARDGGIMFLTPILQDGIAACEIGWNYFFPDENMPTAITLLGEYDTWRKENEFRWENAILPFQYGMREVCSSPETFPNELFYVYSIENGSPIYRIIYSGNTIISYQDKQNERLCKSSAFEVDFMGYKCICLNLAGASSLSFKSVYDESSTTL